MSVNECSDPVCLTCNTHRSWCAKINSLFLFLLFISSADVFLLSLNFSFFTSHKFYWARLGLETVLLMDLLAWLWNWYRVTQQCCNRNCRITFASSKLRPSVCHCDPLNHPENSPLPFDVNLRNLCGHCMWCAQDEESELSARSRLIKGQKKSSAGQRIVWGEVNWWTIFQRENSSIFISRELFFMLHSGNHIPSNRFDHQPSIGEVSNQFSGNRTPRRREWIRLWRNFRKNTRNWRKRYSKNGNLMTLLFG